jgi:hypothetical protein
MFTELCKSCRSTHQRKIVRVVKHIPGAGYGVWKKRASDARQEPFRFLKFALTKKIKTRTASFVRLFSSYHLLFVFSFALINYKFLAFVQTVNKNNILHCIFNERLSKIPRSSTATPEKRTRRSSESTFAKKTVPGTVDHLREELILKSLVPPNCLVQNFRQICNSHLDILGIPGLERLKSQKRRSKLKELQELNYSSFAAHCARYNITCPKTLDECLENKSPSDDDDTDRTVVHSPCEDDSIETVESRHSKAKMSNPFHPKMLLGTSSKQEDEEEVGKLPCRVIVALFISFSFHIISRLLLFLSFKYSSVVLFRLG